MVSFLSSHLYCNSYPRRPLKLSYRREKNPSRIKIAGQHKRESIKKQTLGRGWNALEFPTTRLLGTHRMREEHCGQTCTGGGGPLSSLTTLYNSHKDSHLGALTYEMLSRRQSLNAVRQNPELDWISTRICTLQL